MACAPRTNAYALLAAGDVWLHAAQRDCRVCPLHVRAPLHHPSDSFGAQADALTWASTYCAKRQALHEPGTSPLQAQHGHRAFRSCQHSFKVREPAHCRADRQTADRRAGAGAGRGHTRGGALGARRAAARGRRAARAQQGRPRGHAVRVHLRRRPARARPGGQLRAPERPAGAVWRRRHAGHGGADGPRRGGLALRQSARAAAHLLPHQGGARRLALVALGRTCAMPCCCKVWRARGSSVACAPCMCACRQGCRRAAQRGRLGGACVAEGLAGCCREGFARTPCW